MTPVYVIAALVILLTALVCYAFISQHLEKKRKQRQRLLQALRLRQELFRSLVTTLPSGFLPPDLNKLVHRTLVGICEQLAKLEPTANHAVMAQEYTRQLEASPAPTNERVRIEGEQAILTARSLLQELLRFLIAWAERGQLNKSLAIKYSSQVRRLILQVTIDGYLDQARTARQNLKPRLAIHYYTLARQQLQKAPPQQQVSKQIDHLTTLIEQLEEQMDDAATAATPSAEDDRDVKAWEQLEEEENWKKKQLYD